MHNSSETPERPLLQHLRSPWGIAAAIIALFFVGQGYLAWRDRSVTEALENDPAFATPPLEVSFSRKLPYDPLSFIGRGRQAGLWEWTPQGLVLTEQGRQYFHQSGDLFISHAVAGRRRIQRVRINQATAQGGRRIEFIYQWTEVTPPGAALLKPPPRTEEQYPGEAVLSRQEGDWKLTSLRTRDFEDSLERLKEAASGVLK